jgi:hypothetical protein
MTRRVVALAAALSVAALSPALPGRQDPIDVTAADLLELYDVGEFEMVAEAVRRAARGDLRVVLTYLRQEGEPWIALDGERQRSRRQLTAAAFALEVAAAGLDTQWLTSRDLLEWACTLLRGRGAPGPAERTFHLAALAVIEGARDVEALDAHVGHVRRRFPDEPRLLLASAFKAETEYWRLYRDISGTADGGQASLVRPALRKAGERRENAREAALRLGFLALQDDDPAGALRELAKVPPGDDPGQLYLAHLFSGWSHAARKDIPAAIASYRAALDALPRAQSATLHLALQLYATGERAEADAVVEGMLSASPPVLDPWRIFGYGDLRRFPALIAALRNEIR